VANKRAPFDDQHRLGEPEHAHFDEVLGHGLAEQRAAERALAIVDRDHAAAFEQFCPEALLECGLVVALYHRAFMAIDQDRAAIDECHAKRDGSTGNYLRRTGLGPAVSSSG
jgi:hypothetical protein